MSETQETQDAVFALLADPATHGGQAVKRLDTHAAAVFLAGPMAYKVKRAVVFPFLDYSTLAKRKAACEAEIEVNRPYAPEIYRRVVPITREANGRLALDGKGEPVEWAVEMRRFDETRTLDHLAARGELSLALADEIARGVAKAHAEAPVMEARPWIASLSSYIDQNDAEMRQRPELFPIRAIEALSQASRAALARVDPLIRARGAIGLIRRGHGDLHLANIALIDGKPVAFDAIEFDPMIATGDVLYDLAFLLMDLVNRDLDRAANVVLNRYLAETRRLEDLDGLAALPLYLSLRAAIRAKVTAARLAFAPASDHAAVISAAQAYFRLALVLISPSAPVLLAIGGLSGTGKSVLARTLAPLVLPPPGAIVLRSDVERKALFGKAETERLPADAYAPEVTARVYALLAEKARRVVAAGHSAIVDAVFAKPAERTRIAEVAKTAKVRFRGLFLVADLATRLARVGARAHDASDASVDIARAQERYDLGALEWPQVDACGSERDTLIKARMALAAAASPSGEPCAGRAST